MLNDNISLWNEAQPSDFAEILKPLGPVETFQVEMMVRTAERIRALIAFPDERRDLPWTKALNEAMTRFRRLMRDFNRWRKQVAELKKPLICLADIIAEEEAEERKARKTRQAVQIACQGHDGLVELPYRKSKGERSKLYRSMTAKPAKRRKNGPKPTDVAPRN